MGVLQRPNWDGSPVDAGELFVMRKGRREATCKLVTHQFGWEVRLILAPPGDVMLRKVCRSQDDVLTTGEQWNAAMIEKGWRTFSELSNTLGAKPVEGTREQSEARHTTGARRRSAERESV